ncbi:hypothetical protein K525DRAFT_176461, partial [Schizophyllum commune Loenen D]
LGHANYQSVYDLLTKRLATGTRADLSLQPPRCADCLRGKQVKSSVAKVRRGSKSERRLALVYVDLCGSFDTQSIHGNSYFMTIVDDY